MKKYLAILSSILIITSCDIVEGPYLTDETINPIDTTTNTYVKKVLVEDFTGHKCPNCPDAARELDAIHDIYGEQIIGMAIHVSKSFARPYPASQAPSFQYDFRTQWGDNWDDFYPHYFPHYFHHYFHPRFRHCQNCTQTICCNQKVDL